ncbi:MAG TPA: tetratricopeptide repeat protein [Thermoanaerobaculia bacterium]|nr:tetratricopeptide repeat protein [Thermoanaerobaculia bacterium]
MGRRLTHRQLRVSILALWHDLSFKEIGAAAGIPQKQVSQSLRPLAGRKDLSDRNYERLLSGLPSSPAAVHVVAAFLETLEALESDDQTKEERALVEETIVECCRQIRKILAEAVKLSRATPERGYPEPGDVSRCRYEADALWSRLKNLSAEARLDVVRVAEAYQTWSLCERICQESVSEASRDVESAAALARLAQEIAERIPGPAGWRDRLRGLAAGHSANVLRVSGNLRPADAALEDAKRLWRAGSDPDSVLDPGRLFDLEASLRRDQRRFEEALAALDRAIEMGRAPARCLIKKGFTLEVMGDYERAVETLLQAAPLVESLGEPRLLYMLRFNLAVNFTHTDRYDEAAELLEQVRQLAASRGDENETIRIYWLEGRIAAGLGRREEALKLLQQARRQFSHRNMVADAALALLEEALLLLSDGQSIGKLAKELAWLLDSKGVHREALVAMRLFHEEAERETATVEMARRLLAFLHRARYDKSLQFTL